MSEHANGYLTPNTRVSQGRIADNLWPVLDRRRECSTALRGMPRTALAPFSMLEHASALRPQLVSTSARRLASPGGVLTSMGIEVGRALLQFHRRAGLFELRLEGVGVLAAQGLLDGVGGLVDKGLRLLQAEACRCPDDLYDLDLLLAWALEHDVELGLLLFGGGSAIAGRASGGGCCYGCGGDAEALLQGLHQFRELENGHVLDRLHQFFFVECHRWVLLSLFDYDCSALCFCSAIWPSATTRPWTVLLSTVTSPVSGEEMPPTIWASSCSRPGSLLKATTSASPSTRPPSRRPPLSAKDSTWSANSAISFALATGSSEKARAVGPTRNSEIPSTPASSAALLVRVFFATTKSTPDSRLRRRRSVLLATSMPW